MTMLRVSVIATTALLLANSAVAGQSCGSGAARLQVDLERSLIKWKGTKFWGLGQHEGIVRLKSGGVCVDSGRITGASFIADMKTIEPTDIPKDDPIPRKRLTDHLLGEDFFHVSAHPESRLVITSVRQERQSRYLVGANLTMRGQTHAITFYAHIWTLTEGAVRATARFPIDRHRWGVAYVGTNLRDDLVDEQFWLELNLETHGRARR